ncbi:metallophosphoesterase [Baaleninema simplex]|uniref:metallophosphoesterase n=1 Tax=Baaleninema simplex TaxID=2862350 RepID=UPI0003489961|nr:metallophosphoesterase [Baaleninema simplex]
MHSVFSGPLQVERLAIAIEALPPHLHGMRVVQLSDLHYDGLRLSDRLLDRAISVCNEQEPDLVVLTGDYVTTDPEPAWELVRHLKRLESRAGVYAVLGNHDLYRRRSKAVVTKALESIGIHVLWNQVAYPFGDSVALVGLPDLWARDFKPASLFASIPSEIPRLVLSHNPDSAEVLQRWRADLILSGHTHGGQIVVPGIGPLALALEPMRQIVPKPLRRFVPYLSECKKVVEHWEHALGLHRVGENLLYVNRGLGTYFPGRLFCWPELTVFTLEPKLERSLEVKDRDVVLFSQ